MQSAITRISSPAADPALAKALYNKITWKLIPVLFLCYIFAYLDRVNVGFAKLAMKEEPWFSDAVFATGSGIFFVGYFLFEVPGNIIMHRVGARLWITRIMISWGILSSLCALSTNSTVFYTLRFLLGMAEAGFFPAIILYLTYWFPSTHRARLVALFMTAVAFAGILGSPISGWILEVTEGGAEVKSWQWLFILEGIPSILFGLAMPWLLYNTPEEARWLTSSEKALLKDHLEKDQQKKAAAGWNLHKLSNAFQSPQVWIFSLIYFCFVIGLYGVSFWLPQIIESTITKNKWHIGLYAAIPWTFASIVMVVFGRHSDRSGERRLHLSIGGWITGLAFVISGLEGLDKVSLMIALTVATGGMMSVVSGFWALPTAVLSGTAAAAGIALINSIGNLAGYLSPELFVWLKTHYDMGVALMSIGCSLALGGLLVFLTCKK